MGTVNNDAVIVNCRLLDQQLARVGCNGTKSGGSSDRSKVMGNAAKQLPL